MLTSRSCSWCHEMNPATERYCRSCHHEAHVCRMDCACSRCWRARRASGIDTPAALADLIAEDAAAFQSSTDPVQERATEAKGEAPAEKSTLEEGTTDGVKRTRVRPDLAHQIRVLFDALVTEFGFDLYLSIWIGDGLVCASNAKEGLVVPMVATESPPVAP